MDKRMSCIEVRQGNALDLFKVLKNQSIDLIIADPPYNLGKDYGNNHDLKGFAEYLDFSNKWLAEAKRVLKDTGTIYVFMLFLQTFSNCFIWVKVLFNCFHRSSTPINKAYKFSTPTQSFNANTACSCE